ncbi:hypothetical protein AS589_09355 [Empedobacter brevis]|uniref:hypothetical protein n=1 Tax=Empedobacter brevis TaxID=247 RepID=UPI0013200C96|nr:hypothetical protein [Empedobacter brevis]QHC84962.1 hypothetical protein AS589_09355 [Empedobacter brevis]
MKTVEQIKNEYAVEQGYEDWTHLLAHHILVSSDEIDNHINSVIQLIQDEFKKKIANIEDINIEHMDAQGVYHFVIGTEKETILNTENIK